jgi:hypothetical protein
MHFGRYDPIDDLVADRLSPLVRPRERVFSLFEGTAQAGGFLTPGFRWQQFGATYMMDRSALEELTRQHARAARDLDPAALEALKVRFAVLRPHDIARLTPQGRKALEDPARFVHLFDVGLLGQRRQVYRVVEP